MKGKNFIFFVLFVTVSFSTFAQNIVVSEDSTFSGTTGNALFEVHSANGNKGVLIPRLTTAQRTSIATTGVDEGLVVYDTNTHSFWVWNGSQWTELSDKQTLSLNGDTLHISNGNSVVIPVDSSAYQILSLSGDSLFISGGNGVALSQFMDNTDNQNLHISGYTLSIDNGNSVILPDSQQLSLSNDTLYLTNGGYVDLSIYMDNTDNQTLSLSGDTLYISGGDSVILPSITDSAWSLNGNSITNGQFLGTTNNQPLELYTNNTLHARLTQKGQLEILNTGGSVFIGEGAGNSSNITNGKNVLIGFQSGYSGTTAFYNTALGAQSLYSHTTGHDNVAIGYQSLFSSQTNFHNIAIGSQALYNNKANNNTAIGCQSLYNNISGLNNTAIGYTTMYQNTSGYNNTAVGYQAMYYNESGAYNTACGDQSLYNSKTGSYNSAFGRFALHNNRNGQRNTAGGYSALYSNTSGEYNTAFGTYSLFSDTSGLYNTAFGHNTLYSLIKGTENTYIGAFSDVESSNSETNYCTALGSRSKIANGVTNSTVIGYRAYTNQSNTIVLGSVNGINGATSDVNVGIGTSTPQVRLEVKGEPNTEIFRISNDGTTYPLQVFLGNDMSNVQNNDGVVYFEVIGNETYVFGGHVVADADASRHLGTSTHRWQDVWAANGTIQTSDINDKTNIKPLNYGLNEVLKLNPIAFRWKKDNLNYNDFKIGFSAQELQKVIPEVVIKDKDNPNSSLGVMYSDIIPVLVNAIKQQQTQIEQLKKQNEEILKRLNNLENK